MKLRGKNPYIWVATDEGLLPFDIFYGKSGMIVANIKNGYVLFSPSTAPADFLTSTGVYGSSALLELGFSWVGNCSSPCVEEAKG